jgi:hypothetical protein
MSQLETTRPIGTLTEQARQAYEEKRTKDCLDLTRAILLIDPENTEAQMMRSSIRSEMNQDLENARSLLRLAETKEIAEESSFAVMAEEAPGPAIRRPSAGLMKGLAMVGVLIVLAVGVPRFLSKSDALPAAPAPPVRVPVPKHAIEMSDEPFVRADLLPSGSAPAAALEASPAPPEAAVRQPVVKDRAPVSVPTAIGILAVSSATSVDIYKGDEYVASAPVSMELPAGAHTLEYRHGNLRMTQTHVITGNETTRARINFDVTVQINSRPWAEVFVDGVEKRALGQTPLSNVRVPIGGVLVFQNPAFQKKTYRVTGNESGIRMVFP